MIKIVSKKLRNIITKDGNKLGTRKIYQVNKFEFEQHIKPGIILYIKSMEDLELYKNDAVWCVGGIIEEGVFIVWYEFAGIIKHEPIAQVTVEQAINMVNNFYGEYKHVKYILIKSVDETITIPKIDF